MFSLDAQQASVKLLASPQLPEVVEAVLQQARRAVHTAQVPAAPRRLERALSWFVDDSK